MGKRDTKKSEVDAKSNGWMVWVAAAIVLVVAIFFGAKQQLDAGAAYGDATKTVEVEHLYSGPIEPFPDVDVHEQRGKDNIYEAVLTHCPQRDDQSNPVSRCIPPSRRCRRMVLDDLVAGDDADSLVGLLEHMLYRFGNGGCKGGPSLLDLNMGIISHGDNFADLNKVITQVIKQNQKASDEGDAEVDVLDEHKDTLTKYLEIVRKIHREVTLFYLRPSDEPVADEDAFYEANKHILRIAPPTFFSKIVGNASPKKINDEYWHEHIDTQQYGTFAVTTLLYLNTQKQVLKEDTPADHKSTGSFTGGSFIFGAPHNSTIHPKLARLSTFTSGAENPHRVEKVATGTRYALTSAFTCETKPQASYPLYPVPEGAPKAPLFLSKLFRTLEITA